MRHKILFLSQSLPYPPHSGVTNRTFHILSELEKEFDNLQLLSGEGASLVLEGVPKVMRDRVQRVRFDLSPDYRIDRILIEEIDGATTEFRFTRQTENLAMADEKFRFTAPPGVQVLEASEVTP